MIIGACEIELYAEWVKSLKEKRMIRQSLIEKLRNKFNVSVAEIDKLDQHKTIVIGIVCVSNDSKHIQQVLEKVIDYIESSTDAKMYVIQTEIIE